MKTRILLLSLLLSLFTGCATNPQRTLAATQDVIYGAKKSWVAYCKAEYKRIDNLPAEQQIPLRDALKKRRDNVRELSVRIDAAWDVAWIAAKYDNQKPPTGELIDLVAKLKLAIAP
jgi:hypothetical protein